MNERLVVRLVRKDTGERVAINSVTDGGVRLNDETDAWPRGMSLEFDSQDLATGVRMRHVREARGWHPYLFKLNAHVASGDLVFSGVDGAALPPGSYWFKLRIADLVISKKREKVRIQENGEGVVSCEVTDDPRQFVLNSKLDDFDPEIARVLSAAESRLDGRSIMEWLEHPAPRARRKACLLNVLARLRARPTVGNPLIGHVRSVFFADVDRLYAAVSSDLVSYLRQLASVGKVSDEGPPSSGSHRLLLDRLGAFESDALAYTLTSYRDRKDPSLQLSIARPPAAGTGRYYADIDIDLGNPLNDIRGFLVHMGELIDPGKTDHLALLKDLTRDAQTAPFIYWRVA